MITCSPSSMSSCIMAAAWADPVTLLSTDTPWEYRNMSICISSFPVSCFRNSHASFSCFVLLLIPMRRESTLERFSPSFPAGNVMPSHWNLVYFLIR